MSIVTKTGDGGTTGLFGGARVPKDDARLHAYGTVDELNAVLGLCLADRDLPELLRSPLMRCQQLLFRVGADLATPLSSTARTHRIQPTHVQEVETWVTALEGTLPPQTSFLLPGGSHVASHLHLARTVCRRAERWMVTLMHAEPVNDQATIFMNRLSDWLFLAARSANHAAGNVETAVQYDDEPA